jgi:molybdenum cofactor cytidylyltransferase
VRRRLRGGAGGRGRERGADRRGGAGDRRGGGGGRPPGEQIHSLRAALRALDDAVSAVVVAPVDLPHLSAGVVAALIAARERSGAPVVVPVHGGKRGHPVLFARAVFPELQADPLQEGARTVVHAHAATLEEVPVTEPGVLDEVNTPEDFRRVVRRCP